MTQPHKLADVSLRLLVAAAALCCLGLLLRQEPRSVSSGDALFDWFLTRLRSSSDTLLKAYYAGHVLPAGSLQASQVAFPEDPRLPELQSTSCTVDGENFIEAGGAGDLRSWQQELLQRGCSTGQARANTVVALLYQLETDWGVQAHNSLGQTGPRAQGLNGAYTAQQKVELIEQAWARFAVIEQQHGPQRRSLYEQLAALGPQVSGTHYRLAFYHWTCGDREAALAELKAGNSAPVNELLREFPFDAISRLKQAGRLPDDRTGRVLSLASAQATLEFPGDMPLMTYDLLGWLLHSNRPAEIGVLRDYAMRLSRSGDIAVGQGLNFDRRLIPGRTLVSDFAPLLDPEGLKAAHEIDQTLDALRAEYQRIEQTCPTQLRFQRNRSDLLDAERILFDPLTDGALSERQTLDLAWQDEAYEEQNLQGLAATLIQESKEFDYGRLSGHLNPAAAGVPLAEFPAQKP